LKNARVLLSLSLIALFSVLTAFTQKRQQPIQAATAEVEKLQQESKAHPITDPDLSSVNSDVQDGLKRAADAFKADRLYLGLERLDAYGGLYRAALFMQQHRTGHGDDMPAFDAAWKKATVQATALESPPQSAAHFPAAVQAVVEKAFIQSSTLADAGRGFALATKPADGYFYLGQSFAEADFVRFCRQLAIHRSGTPFPLRSLLPEIQRLQEQTNAAFQPPKSIDQHPQFIRLNSTIKLAGELDARKFYAGALYQYLDALQQFSLLSQAVPEATQQASVRTSLAALRKQLDSSKRDESIGQLFLERAEAALSIAGGATPGETEWKRARAIAEAVMPAYLAAARPASPAIRAGARSATITLVRWPYT